MNRNMLPKLVNKMVVLRPNVISVFSLVDGSIERLVIRTWPWRVMAYQDRVLTLQNITTSHVLPLPDDHCYEYRANIGSRPDFLVLRSQVYINAMDVWLEPIHNWRPEIVLRNSAYPR
jgi:hypothetical protein